MNPCSNWKKRQQSSKEKCTASKRNTENVQMNTSASSLSNVLTSKRTPPDLIEEVLQLKVIAKTLLPSLDRPVI